MCAAAGAAEPSGSHSDSDSGAGLPKKLRAFRCRPFQPGTPLTFKLVGPIMNAKVGALSRMLKKCVTGVGRLRMRSRLKKAKSQFTLKPFTSTLKPANGAD